MVVIRYPAPPVDGMVFGHISLNVGIFAHSL
jgi:hypothetical protein